MVNYTCTINRKVRECFDYNLIAEVSYETLICNFTLHRQMNILLTIVLTQGRRKERKEKTIYCGHRVYVRWFSMSPWPRLHHHDIMTIVELFFINSVRTCTIRNKTSCYDGALKTVQCTTVVSNVL